jgi:TolB-like protein
MRALPLILALGLASAASAEDPPAKDEPIQVVVLGLETTELDAGKVALVDGLIADAISRSPKLKVLTKSDIERLAAFETDKAVIGCDEGNCLAEIAGAMGAAYVVFGRIGTLDDLILVQVNLFDANKAEAIGREDVRANSLRELDGKVQPAVQRLLSPLTGYQAAEPADEGGGGISMAWIGAGALAVAGIAAGGFGLTQIPVVENQDNTAQKRNDAKALGAAMVVTGGVCLALAAVGAGIGVVGMVTE